MTPILSVIVPVYNVEAYLERCVDSLRGQTLKEIEILLIDDGSTDKSGSLCDKLAKKDDRIRAVHKENAGQGFARNEGLNIAQGKYVAFVDSDDYMETDVYEYMTAYMEAEKAELGCFGYEHLSPEGERISCPHVEKNVYRKKAVVKEFLPHYFGDAPEKDDLRGVSACMSIFRRDIVEGHGIRFQSERVVFSEDTLFNLDYCRYVSCAAVSDRVFYHYCLKADSFTKGYQADKWEKVCSFADILRRYAKEYGIEDIAERRICSMLWINLMAVIKQEAGRWGERPYPKVRRKIKAICNDKEVVLLLENFDAKRLNGKQKLFYHLIKGKWHDGIFLLSYLRNRRGL